MKMPWLVQPEEQVGPNVRAVVCVEDGKEFGRREKSQGRDVVQRIGKSDCGGNEKNPGDLEPAQVLFTPLSKR